MKIKINCRGEITDLFSIVCLNGLVLLACFFASFLNDILYLLAYVVTVGGYYAFLLKRCNTIRIVKYQIILLIMSMLFLDVMFYLFKVSTPYEIYYISEGISILLLFKIAFEKKRHRNIMNDSFLMLVFITILSSFAITIFNGADLGSYFNTLRVLFRYIPVYIVLSRHKVEYKNMYKVLYFFNIIFFVGEWLVLGNQDYRNGIFGFVGGSCFQIFIMIYLVYVLVGYLCKQTSVWHLAGVFLFNVVMLIIAESKASIVFVAIICVMISMIVDTKLIKKIMIVTVGCIAIIVGIQIIGKIYPDFRYLANLDTVGSFIQSYIFGNSNLNYTMGRFEGMEYICQQEQVSFLDKMFGLGLGEAMPQERWFHIERAGGRTVFDFPASPIFAKYGSSFGYHMSILSWLRIGTGYVGVAMAILIILCIIYKSGFLLKNGVNIEEKAMGGMGFFIAVMGIYTNGYSGGMLNTGYVLSVMVLLGIMQYHYDQCRKRMKYSGKEESV